MVIFGLSSLRGSALNFKLFSTVLESGLPCWTVIQNWVLRYGLYKLLSPLPKRNDWILILDHTIEFGTRNCLVVLAVSREAFLRKKCQLQHCDVQVAAIKAKDCSRGKDIADILSGLSDEMGVPAQIVSDAGSNIKAGIKAFRGAVKKEDPTAKVISTYDITHKAGILIKHLLKDDSDWKDFTRKLADTKRNVIYTEFVSYAPNRPKDKARWLNLEERVTWAEKILAISSARSRRAGEKATEDRRFDEHFGWVKAHKRNIVLWRAYLEILSIAKKEIKHNGLSKQIPAIVAKQLRRVKSKRKEVTDLKTRMISFLREETADFADSEEWLGTSDIIESVFGKYKVFSARTPLKEIGKSILTIPVFTSPVSLPDVREAMETISDKMLRKWLAENIGESLFSRRRKAFQVKKRESV
jgi:hypothetical protein